MMRRLTPALALGATLGVVALAGPAFAAGPYNVTVGGSSSGTPTFTATAGAISFSTPLVSMSCSSGTASGTIQPGTGVSGANIATITGRTFSGCLGPLGLPVTVTGTGSWQLNATGTATAGGSDVVAGNISAISANVAQTSNPNACRFTVTGTVDGSFNESAQSLAVTPPSAVGNLTISNVVGCYGLVASGDEGEFSTTYAITSPGGAIGIS